MNTIEVHGPKISFRIPILGGINVTETIILQWLTMAIIMGLVLWLTHGLKMKPSKKQVIAEMIVTAFNKLLLLIIWLLRIWAKRIKSMLHILRCCFSLF